MTETTWSEEGVAPRKRRIPTWAWFCGAGCLLALVVSIVAVVFLVDTVKKAIDPEQQWTRLAETLPYDERPAGWKPVFGMDMSLLGFEMFTLKGPGNEMAMLMQLPENDAERTREQFFDESFTGSLFGAGGRKNLKKGKMTVQGRELDVIRFVQKGGLEVTETEEPASSGEGEANPVETEESPVRIREKRDSASILVDLTPPGEVRPLILQMIRTGSGEPFTDQEVLDFLKPFHVGTLR
jgi:hypothetical protein